MRLALKLAARARGGTRPNPMVGAVVVRSGRIVGTGFHRRAGAPHAEVIALKKAGSKARGAILYVSLEPCAHFGRTPPCATAIAGAGIRRVVAAMIDPNPKNRGRGLQWLRNRGIQTKVGLLEKEARALNEIFVTWKTTGRPFVTVKVAQSLDGKIATATGDSKWISSPAARRWAHFLRAQADAILVGVETILKDNPQLTARVGRRSRQPVKVILDSTLRTPPIARLFSSRTPVIIATSKRAPAAREKHLVRAGAEILRFPAQDGRVSLKALLKELARREISHLLIEGGGEVIASAFATKAVDRIACIIAPKIIGGRTAPTAVEGSGLRMVRDAIPLKNFSIRRLGPDLLVTARPTNP